MEADITTYRILLAKYRTELTSLSERGISPSPVFAPWPTGIRCVSPELGALSNILDDMSEIQWKMNGKHDYREVTSSVTRVNHEGLGCDCAVCTQK